jgi:hypothetical protein
MRRNTVIWIVAFLIAIACAALIVRRLYKSGTAIEGVTLTQDSDARRQAPISGVEVTAVVGEKVVRGTSDAAGGFRLTLPVREVWARESAELQFRHSGYQPLNITPRPSDQIYVIRMSAINSKAAADLSAPQTTLKDVRVRYATKATTPINVGSVAKTLEVVNTGGVPCDPNAPCSPDGKWKAATGGLTLDAGDGHEFQNIRTSCIAGPCPFTRI